MATNTSIIDQIINRAINKIYTIKTIITNIVENSGAEWLKDEIIWPQPGYYAPPFLITSPIQGWIRVVADYQEFADTIDETFGNIFHDRINVLSKIETSNLFDPRDTNNLVKTELTVHSS